MNTRAWYAVVVAVPAVVGCADQPVAALPCQDYAAPALAVSVNDGSLTAITGALVTATDGGYADSARVGQPFPRSANLAWERAGTYRVAASHPGYVTASVPGVRVTSDACHVQTVHVDFYLRRI